MAELLWIVKGCPTKGKILSYLPLLFIGIRGIPDFPITCGCSSESCDLLSQPSSPLPFHPIISPAGPVSQCIWQLSSFRFCCCRSRFKSRNSCLTGCVASRLDLFFHFSFRLSSTPGQTTLLGVFLLSSYSVISCSVLRRRHPPQRLAQRLCPTSRA